MQNWNLLTHLLLCTLNPQSGKLNNLNFHPLEVVVRGSETQLQVGENY